MTNRDTLMAIIEAQSSEGEIVVSLEAFFNGNDDLGSIGCNLGSEQPSIAEFYKILSVIKSRSDVQDVLVRITHVTIRLHGPVYIITSAPTEEVCKWVAPLKPDEIHPEWMYGKPEAAPEPTPGMLPYSVWWD